MNVAVYARKSTSQGDIADIEKSVVRQISLAKAFAESKGWQVIEEYVDDAVSGRDTLRLLNRARMLADAVMGKFSAIIVRDFDRISRDDREGPGFVYMLHDAGVEVWEYSTRAPIKVERALDRTMLNMKAGFATHEAEEASKRTREQKFERAGRGEIADGRVLGYRTVGEAKSRHREIDPEQARVVVKIFELAAEGLGLLRIAKRLNSEGVRNPTAQDWRQSNERAAGTFSTTGIREVLHRSLYRGVQTYGKTKWVRAGGKKRKVDVPESEWVKRERPELRIVSDDLWQRAHDRLAATRAVYLRRNDGRLSSKPESGLESKYLLSGFLRCGTCGGNLLATKRTGRGGAKLYYVCSNHYKRGSKVCGMTQGIVMKDLDEAIFRALREQIWRPEVIADIASQMAERLAKEPDGETA
jgi:site-specific DNA recombinase